MSSERHAERTEDDRRFEFGLLIFVFLWMVIMVLMDVFKKV